MTPRFQPKRLYFMLLLFLYIDKHRNGIYHILLIMEDSHFWKLWSHMKNGKM